MIFIKKSYELLEFFAGLNSKLFERE